MTLYLLNKVVLQLSNKLIFLKDVLKLHVKLR